VAYNVRTDLRLVANTGPGTDVSRGRGR